MNSRGDASEREMPKPWTPGPCSGLDAHRSLEKRGERKAMSAISQKKKKSLCFGKAPCMLSGDTEG